MCLCVCVCVLGVGGGGRQRIFFLFIKPLEMLTTAIFHYSIQSSQSFFVNDIFRLLLSFSEAHI